VRDEGPGFDPGAVPDPLHPDNLLKASGRGIFLIRSFMDELRLQPAAEGRHGSRDGEARRRRHAAGVTAPDPVYLATAVEIVLRAGEIQMAGRESGFRVAKKGAIDLVTEVDLACERMCRAVLAERFPEHDILAEELSAGPHEAARAPYRWVFDPLDGTTKLRAWPADLLRVARAGARRPADRQRDLRPVAA
jgi:hypothetical protein